MSSIDSVLPVQVLIDPSRRGTAVKMVMSPLMPDSCVLIYEDAPPEVHNFKRAELMGDRETGYVLELDKSTLSVDCKTGLPIAFRCAARCVAYRPGVHEIAMVFSSLDGEEPDSSVWRFNPLTGKQMSPIYFENPSCVAYNSEGDLLAVGGAVGVVTVFRLHGSDEVEELRSVELHGGIRELVFEELGNQLYVATENNQLVSFSYNTDEDAPIQRGLQTEDGQRFDNMCLSALAYSANSAMVATAGVGNEVWVSNPLTAKGRYVRLRETTRIHTLQFDDNSDSLTVFGDGGVELLEFSLDAQHLAVFEERTIRFSPRIHMVGCHHYGHFLFIASILP